MATIEITVEEAKALETLIRRIIDDGVPGSLIHSCAEEMLVVLRLEQRTRIWPEGPPIPWSRKGKVK